MPATQFVEKGRLLTLDTPLGANKLLLESFSGTEAISRLFEFELSLFSEDTSLDFSQILGQKVTFGVNLNQPGKQRLFNGHVCRFAQLPSATRLARYRALVVPWLWFLSRTADCRIFQNKSVPEIVQEVFNDFGFTDFETQLQGQHSKRDYCVQYRETALNFVMRLLEEEGIFFFFKHEKTKHTLVLADAPAAHKPCPAQPKAKWERSFGPGYKRREDTVFAWNLEQELRTGKYALTDYNFETPATSLLANIDSVVQVGDNTRFETFDYPGDYATKNDGSGVVRLRMEEEETEHLVVSGEGNCRGMISGYRFELFGHERRDQNGQYVLTSITHAADEGGFYSGEGSGESTYTNRFTAIPLAVPFRPARVTPKPVVRGCQTATVTGPAGEEIHTDQYGRVKVHFHWDRHGQCDDKSSCWIRVSQPWAGRGWGAISIPRIGQEVVVDFLEGDPDRPLITGRVYNATETVPYPLPGDQTKTTLKTNSSKGGGGFNEIRLEDKKGSEEIFVHGEKNLDVRIKNDRREWVGNDRHLFVQQDLCEQVNRDLHSTVNRDRVEYTDRDHSVKIKGKQAVEINGSHCLHVSGDVIRKCDKNVSWSISGGAFAVDAMKVVLDSSQGLTISCGGSFITLNAGGVFISGPMVNINTGGAPLSFAPASMFTAADPLKALIAGDARPGAQGAGAAGAAPSHNPNSTQNQEKTAWIEIQLVDEDGKPVGGEQYRVTLPDGSVDEGTLDEKGSARIEHIDPGSCKITFPNLDQEAWEPK